jgi:hypothetical protein
MLDSLYLEIRLYLYASIYDHKNCYIITAYEPDIKLWDENFTTKKYNIIHY